MHIRCEVALYSLCSHMCLRVPVDSDVAVDLLVGVSKTYITNFAAARYVFNARSIYTILLSCMCMCVRPYSDAALH